MPTYQNDTATVQNLKGPRSSGIQVAAGATVEVMFYTDDANFSLTDVEPYVNRVLNRQEITLTGTAQDVTILLNTDYVIVFKITDSVTVYSQAEANTPPELNEWTAEDPVIQIPAKGRFNNLAMLGSGTCEVVEYTV